MKRYNNLYKKIIDLDNLKLAHHNAQKGKKHYPEIQKINNNENHYLDELYQMLNDKTFTTSQYKVFKIIEPKERLIYKLPYFPDRIVQHAIMQILQPIWDKTFIFDSYAAVPGKGIHAGYYRLQQFLNNNNKITYCLKMDIKKFYPNVSTQKQKKDLENQIDLLKNFSFQNGWQVNSIYSDIASGISFDKRKDFFIMLDEILNNKIEKVIVTYKDRLSRVGFGLFSHLFKQFGTEIVVLSDTGSNKLDSEEIFEEIIAMLHCYSMKLYSKRKHKIIKEFIKNEAG